MLRSGAPTPIKRPGNNVYTGYGDVEDIFYYYGVMNDGKFFFDNRRIIINELSFCDVISTLLLLWSNYYRVYSLKFKRMDCPFKISPKYREKVTVAVILILCVSSF